MSDLTRLVIFFVFLLAVVGTAAWAGLRAAPWLPTRRRDIYRLLNLSGLKPGEQFYDLGCGDGRVLTIAATTYGARAVGYEISLLPFLVAKLRQLLSAGRKNISVRYGDFYRAPLSDADVVFCFLTPAAMQRLRTKFVHELKPGARLVSYTFSLAGLEGVVKDKPSPRHPTAYLYRQPTEVEHVDAP